jgi:hypothetical protein
MSIEEAKEALNLYRGESPLFEEGVITRSPMFIEEALENYILGEKGPLEGLHTSRARWTLGDSSPETHPSQRVSSRKGQEGLLSGRDDPLPRPAARAPRRDQGWLAPPLFVIEGARRRGSDFLEP